MQWRKHFSSPASIPSVVTSQFLWFGRDIKIYEKCIYFKELSKKGVSFVGNLFGSDGNIKPQVTTKEVFYLLEPRKFQWMQLINA